MSKTSSYHEALIESLADPVEAKHYLQAVLEDYPEGFLKALRNVAQANQMKRVAEAAGIKRESLYRALSDKGNPTLDTLTGVLSAVGLKLSIVRVGADEATSPEAFPSTYDHALEQEFAAPVVVDKTCVVARGAYDFQNQPFGPLGVATKGYSTNIGAHWTTGDAYVKVH